MPIKINGATSGGITLDVPAAAGTNTLTLPAKTGNIITSADSGTVTQAMLASNVAGNGPSFAYYISSNQSTNNSTDTLIAFNTKSWDTNNCFNNTNATATLNGLSVPAYAFMPNVAGYYAISMAMSQGFTGTGLTYLSVWRNGSANYLQPIRFMNNSSGAQNFSFSVPIYFNGTSDYIQIYIFQNSGSTQAATLNSGTATQLMGAMVRAA